MSDARGSEVLSDFARRIKDLSGVDVGKCFQCRRCSSGCPVVAHMDVPPARLVKMILAGRADEVLASKTIWLCASCYACSARCPNDIDFVAVADALRALALRERRRPGVPDVAALHQVFMEDVACRGRVHEVSFISRLKMRTFDLLGDFELGLAMFFKGKLPLVPKGVKDAKAIQTAFGLEKKPHGEKP